MTSKKAKYAPRVTCPHCVKTFNANEVQGSWLARKCPHCKKSLSTDVFDKHVVRMLQTQDRLAEKRNNEKDLAKRHQSMSALIRNPLLKPLKKALRKNACRHHRNMARYTNEAETIQSSFIVMARSRYYASEWYQLSGAPLANQDGPLPEYALHTDYDRDGKIQLMRNKDGAASGGILGEWQVFESLIPFITKSGSFLKGARLIPNAFLPSAIKDDFKDQTDLIILTQKAAFICEIKHWQAHVAVSKTVNRPYISLYSNKSRTKQHFHSGEKPVEQIDQRMADFAAIGIYPEECIFGLVVFAEPESFFTTLDGFAGRKSVVTSYPDGTGTLINLLASTVDNAAACVPQVIVDELADAMLDNWVDKDGSLFLEQLHTRSKPENEKRKQKLPTVARLTTVYEQPREQKQVKISGNKTTSCSRPKKGSFNRLARKQRYAYKQRIYENEREFDELDYLSA